MLLHKNRSSATRRKLGNEDLYSLESDLINESLRELENGENIDPVTKLRLLCFSRGVTGLLELCRVFRHMDYDCNKSLNIAEFIKGVHEANLQADDHVIREIFKGFEENDTGYVHMRELLIKLRPPMAESRLNILNQAFAKMDKTGTGITTIKDLRRAYCVNHNTLYETGEMSRDEILEEFIDSFDGGRGNLDGTIMKEEFINYYATISASVKEDSYFDLVLRQIYNV